MTDFFQRSFEAPHDAARAFKAAGGKVVGYLSNNVPIELIHAAGAFPLQLAARPGPTPTADKYMENLFDPVVRSVFDQALTGGLDFLDLIVLPRSNDSFQRLYYYLSEIRRTGAAATPDTVLYDVQLLPTASSAAYTLKRTAELRDRLGALTGATMDEGAVQASIAFYNRIRERLAEVSALRAAPARLGGEAAFLAYAAVGTAAPPALADALRALTATASQTLPVGPRVILVGSAPDRPTLHRQVAAAGGEVVADYHWRGEPMLGPPIAAGGDPVAAIADHYHRHSFATRSFPTSNETLTALAKSSGADCAIFFYLSEEEALVWEYPAQAAALQAMGLRTLTLNGQTWPPSEANAEPIANFLSRASA
jgi:benzoyl-CoA reductase/2-hydroxyglutaryl-CoA dehydratase subunit BcrC/BadD/HgdB